ncbi:MAG: fibronectin type III domain-containing protein [Nitrospinae bacterium]|nr:fibronectin type III domain-containing protein [Nitrospinota bacterium]
MRRFAFFALVVLTAGLSACGKENKTGSGGPAPATPSGITTIANDGAVTIRWNPVQNAKSYNIYFSAKPGAPKAGRTKIADVKQAPYEHVVVDRKTMYFYVVSAVNSAGEGPASTESGATP